MINLKQFVKPFAASIAEPWQTMTQLKSFNWRMNLENDGAEKLNAELLLTAELTLLLLHVGSVVTRGNFSFQHSLDILAICLSFFAAFVSITY